MSFVAIRHLHLTLVILSGLGFAFRVVLRFRHDARLQTRLYKIVPHIVDTVLLASGVALVLITHQYPGVSLWITLKLLAVVLYILFAMKAFRASTPDNSRPPYLIAAVCSYLVAFSLGWFNAI